VSVDSKPTNVSPTIHVNVIYAPTTVTREPSARPPVLMVLAVISVIVPVLVPRGRRHTHTHTLAALFGQLIAGPDTLRQRSAVYTTPCRSVPLRRSVCLSVCARSLVAAAEIDAWSAVEAAQGWTTRRTYISALSYRITDKQPPPHPTCALPLCIGQSPSVTTRPRLLTELIGRRTYVRYRR